jgi:YHS domain-containing protein
MARVIIWTIVALIIIRLVWRFVNAVREGLKMGSSGASRRQPSVKLVRDPVCGIYVVPSQALTSGSGSTTQYFCSEKCRREWSAR